MVDKKNDVVDNFHFHIPTQQGRLPLKHQKVTSCTYFKNFQIYYEHVSNFSEILFLNYRGLEILKRKWPEKWFQYFQRGFNISNAVSIFPILQITQFLRKKLVLKNSFRIFDSFSIVSKHF